MAKEYICVDAIEQGWIDRYGFKLSATSDGHFVLVDPYVSKQARRTGGNLWVLIVEAVQVRQEYEKIHGKKTTVKQKLQPKPAEPARPSSKVDFIIEFAYMEGKKAKNEGSPRKCKFVSKEHQEAFFRGYDEVPTE